MQKGVCFRAALHRRDLADDLALNLSKRVFDSNQTLFGT